MKHVVTNLSMELSFYYCSKSHRKVWECKVSNDGIVKSGFGKDYKEAVNEALLEYFVHYVQRNEAREANRTRVHQCTLR